MKYRIVEDLFKHDFEAKINKLIQQGWIPLGGVSYNNGYPNGTMYVQAMIFGGGDGE